MPDPWEPTATDREAYHRGVNRRRGDAEWRSDALLDAGLREAFASLRTRVGEPVTAELMSFGREPVEYHTVYNPDELVAAALDGWRFVAQCWDAAGDPFMLTERPQAPADDS